MFFLGWIFLVPVSYIFPKQKKRIAFIGRDEGLFLDNVKYLYIHAQKYIQSGYDIYFITENKKIYNELMLKKLSCVYHPTINSVFLMLTTNVIVIDSPSWVKRYKYFLLFGSKSLQLWHGVPLKKIQLECQDMEFRKDIPLVKRLKSLYYKVAGHFPTYDIVISTSTFFTRHAFQRAFNTKMLVEANYPRNDILKQHQLDNPDISELELLWTDTKTIHSVNKLKQSGKRIILYAPTFRETGNDLFEKQVNFFDRWDEFGKEKNIIFIVKSHPLPKSLYTIKDYSNILYYDNTKDVYPLLSITDLLITDYSSIYFDYLFLDKPIIFFPYDFDKYITSDKELRFDYDSFTPGPKCRSQDQLENEIVDILIFNNDTFIDHREKIRKLAFKSDVGNGCEENWNLITQLCNKEV